MTTCALAYARVSRVDQNPQLQIDALTKAGVDRIFTDHASGASTSRPQLDELLRTARRGDTIVVWRLDRLGRNMRHLQDLTAELEQRGIGLRSLTEQIDTSTATGKFMFTLMASLAEFERGLLRERSLAGVQAARAQGRFSGRPKALSPQGQETATELHHQGKTVTQIASALKVSRATIYRHLAPILKPVNCG